MCFEKKMKNDIVTLSSQKIFHHDRIFKFEKIRRNFLCAQPKVFNKKNIIFAKRYKAQKK